MLLLISSMINNHIQSCRQAHAVRLMHLLFLMALQEFEP